jgi:hypothetical protein
MHAASCSTIKQALTQYLIDQMGVSQVRDMCVATLPIHTVDQRWVDVFIEPRATDFYFVHDAGKAVNELILQGMKVTPSVEREFALLASRFGIVYSDEMFQTGAKIDRLAETVNAVGMCSALAMVQLLETQRASDDDALEGQIRTALKRWGKGKARVQEQVKVTGEVKQHTFDFVVTPRRGPSIALSVLNPTAGPLSAAERFGFKAQDIQHTEFGKWKRIAVQAKAEVWSQEARKIVERFADLVIEVHTGSPAVQDDLTDALERIA